MAGSLESRQGGFDKPAVGKHVIGRKPDDHCGIWQIGAGPNEAIKDIGETAADAGDAGIHHRFSQQVVSRRFGRGNNNLTTVVAGAPRGKHHGRQPTDGKQCLAGQSRRRHAGLHDDADERRIHLVPPTRADAAPACTVRRNRQSAPGSTQGIGNLVDHPGLLRLAQACIKRQADCLGIVVLGNRELA